jgi:hypothetical protein
MEYALLIKVGMLVKGIVWSGYGVACGYAVKTGVKYISDYKDSVAREKVEVK